MKCAIFSSVLLTLLAVSQAAGQITSEVACTFGAYEQQSAFLRRVYSRQEYETARRSHTVQCQRITYLSDGLQVVGFIVRPLAAEGKRLPVIVYNRGGLLDIGKIEASHLLDFYHFASEGFVVFASQYRGNDGGEGREEFGGADVNDVIILRNLAATLPYADPKNVFFYGVSRGGMMSFLALRRGATVNTIAVVGALLDLPDGLVVTQQRAPGIADRVKKLIPDYGPSALRDRSAIHFADQVNVPVLILHGGADEEVPTSQALAFASTLNDLRKPYELIVYVNDSHEVTNNRNDRNGRLVAWFRRHMR